MAGRAGLIFCMGGWGCGAWVSLQVPHDGKLIQKKRGDHKSCPERKIYAGIDSVVRNTRAWSQFATSWSI